MSFDGDLYPTAGATSVMTTKGDMVDFDSVRQRLAIGSANQILQVKSSLPSWETVPLADTVLTTAGDILYENATPELARLAAGTQYNTLQMGATLPSWSPSATSVMTTTGDLLYASGANTLARLAGGTSGDVLTANGAGVAPSYQTPSGGGAWTILDSQQQTSFTGTTTTFTPTSAIDDSTYQRLQLCMAINADGASGVSAMYFRLNSGLAAGNYYQNGLEIHAGAAAYVDKNPQSGSDDWIRITDDTGQQTNLTIVDIMTPTPINSGATAEISYSGGGGAGTGGYRAYQGSGLVTGLSDISRIQVELQKGSQSIDWSWVVYGIAH